MKKLESTWYNMAGVLTLIAVVAGGALAYVNDLTQGPINEIKAKTLSDGICKVLKAESAVVQKIDSLENGSVVYKTDKGCAVQTTDPNAFGGKLTVLVGLDGQGSILGYQVLETSETPGLGAKAEFWFQEGQKGNIIGKNLGKNSLKVRKDGGDVDAITASTITSRAFLRCVNAAYSAIEGQCDVESGASQQQKNNEGKEENHE